MADCIFCKIINKEIPSKIIYENGDVIAFNDLYPKADTHILVVPKKHIATINDLKEDEEDEILMGKMMLVARDIAKEKKLKGYNLAINVGQSAGQVIFHIHMHLMSNG